MKMFNTKVRILKILAAYMFYFKKLINKKVVPALTKEPGALGAHVPQDFALNKDVPFLSPESAPFA